MRFERAIELDANFEKIIQIVSDIKNADKLLSPFNFDSKIKDVFDKKALVSEKIILPYVKSEISQEATYEFIDPNETRIIILSEIGRAHV